MFSSRNVSISALLRLTVIPVVLGLAAGVTGALMAESYLIAPASVEDNSLLQIGRPTRPVVTALGDVDTADLLKRIDIPLYPRKAAAGADLADRARAPYEAVGYAAVLTSDGWLATHQSVLSAGPVSASVGGRLLEPTAQITDSRTGIVFLKIDVSALAVSGFEDTEQLQAGAPLYAAGQEGLFEAARFGGAILPAGKSAPGVLHDSDKFSLSYRLDRPLDARAVGGAVMTSSGTLAGIVAPGAANVDSFVPMHLIQPILAEVFRGQTPARALLGARYLTPGETVFSEPNLGPIPGVRLSASRAAGAAAVRPGSAAARAGLLEGDVVLRIDGIDLSSGPDLAELVAQYAPGDKARFEITRKGERKTVDVTFD